MARQGSPRPEDVSKCPAPGMASLQAHLPLSRSALRIFRYVRPYRGPMVFAVVCATVSSAAGTAPVLILKRFLDTVLTTHDLLSLRQIAIATTALTIAAAAGTFGQNYILRS